MRRRRAGRQPTAGEPATGSIPVNYSSKSRFGPGAGTGIQECSPRSGQSDARCTNPLGIVVDDRRLLLRPGAATPRCRRQPSHGNCSRAAGIFADAGSFELVATGSTLAATDKLRWPCPQPCRIGNRRSNPSPLRGSRVPRASHSQRWISQMPGRNQWTYQTVEPLEKRRGTQFEFVVTQAKGDSLKLERTIIAPATATDVGIRHQAQTDPPGPLPAATRLKEST